MSKAAPTPLYINGNSVKRVPPLQNLGDLPGTCIPVNLSWSVNNTAVFKKAHQ